MLDFWTYYVGRQCWYTRYIEACLTWFSYVHIVFKRYDLTLSSHRMYTFIWKEMPHSVFHIYLFLTSQSLLLFLFLYIFCHSLRIWFRFIFNASPVSGTRQIVEFVLILNCRWPWRETCSSQLLLLLGWFWLWTYFTSKLISQRWREHQGLGDR